MYLNQWPSGEEAMDMRFEVLLKAIHENGAWTRYVTAASAGVKGLTKPADIDLASMKIFKRLGQEVAQRGGKYFDEMTPEQVARRMRSFHIDMQATKDRKGQR